MSAREAPLLHGRPAGWTPRPPPAFVPFPPPSALPRSAHAGAAPPPPPGARRGSLRPCARAGRGGPGRRAGGSRRPTRLSPRLPAGAAPPRPRRKRNQTRTGDRGRVDPRRAGPPGTALPARAGPSGSTIRRCPPPRRRRRAPRPPPPAGRSQAPPRPAPAGPGLSAAAGGRGAGAAAAGLSPRLAGPGRGRARAPLGGGGARGAGRGARQPPHDVSGDLQALTPPLHPLKTRHTQNLLRAPERRAGAAGNPGCAGKRLGAQHQGQRGGLSHGWICGIEGSQVPACGGHVWLNELGAGSRIEERWPRCSTLRVPAAAGPGSCGPGAEPPPLPTQCCGPATDPGGSLRPAAPHNISRCKWPNEKTRREKTSQSEAADSVFPPPFAPPPVGSATAPRAPLPTSPSVPGGGSPAPIPARLKCSSPPRRRRLSPCHPHPRPLPHTPLLPFPVLLLLLLRVIFILTPAGGLPAIVSDQLPPPS
nr:translation initiation factor IF-2-like [Equus asinus]